MLGEAVDGTIEDVRTRWEATTERQRYGLVAGVLGILLVIPFVATTFFFVNTMIYVFIFIILGHAWNLIGGYGGQISLGHAIFFATGAYGTTILFTYYHVTPIVGVWVAIGVAVLFGLFLGAATFRLRYHYFAMATLAAALAARVIAFRWDFIGAARGIEYPLDQVGTLYSFTFRSLEPYYYLTGVSALLVTLFMWNLDRRKLGTYLKAIHMDQDLAANAGIRTFWYKMYAMGLSAALAAFAGGLYAQYIMFVDPQSTLRLLRNIDIIMVAIIGGIGTVLGPVIGGFIFIPVREYSRSILSGQSAGLAWVVLGLVILLLSMYRPGGLLNKYSGRWGG